MKVSKDDEGSLIFRKPSGRSFFSVACVHIHIITHTHIYIYINPPGFIYHLPMKSTVNPVACSRRNAARVAAGEGARLGLTCQGTITCRSGGDRRWKTQELPGRNVEIFDMYKYIYIYLSI